MLISVTSGPAKLDDVPGAGIVLPGGANVYFLDFAPNYVSPMVSS